MEWSDPMKSSILPVEPDKVLEALLDGILADVVCSTGAVAGVIRLFSATEESLVIAASRGLSNDILEHETCRPINCGVCGLSLIQGIPLHADAHDCNPPQAMPFDDTDCRQISALPLSHCGSRLGVLTLFWASRPASITVALLSSLAKLIALALDNERLSQDNLRMKLMAERQAIANEIHDSLSQSLFYGRLRKSVLSEAIIEQNQPLIHQCLDDIGEALDSGQKSVRELIRHFRLPLDPLGLHHALKMLIDGLKSRTSIIFDYHYPQHQHDLTLEQEMQIFHILRESLNNLVIHSQATHAQVMILEDDTGLTFEVTDNGVGLGSPDSPIDHYGLTIMKERARRIGARLYFHSAPGIGTQVRLFIPGDRASLQE